VDEDTEWVAQQEREQIKEETRQELIGEMAQAEAVEDNGSNNLCRALLCTSIMVVLLLGIILASVLGTRDTSYEL
jgi:hypothetical protein